MKLIFVIVFLLGVGAAAMYGYHLFGGNLADWGVDISTTSDLAQAKNLYTAFNTWRSHHVLEQLRTDDRLCNFVAQRAKELADSNKKPQNFAQFIEKNALSATLPFSAAAELQGSGVDGAETVRLWSEDETQRQILEDKQFTYTCVRCSKSICSQFFVLPKVQ